MNGNLGAKLPEKNQSTENDTAIRLQVDLPIHPLPAVDGTGLDGLEHQLVDTGIVHPPQVGVKEPLGALKTAVVVSYLPEKNNKHK